MRNKFGTTTLSTIAEVKSMSSITENQKSEIRALIQEGKLSSKQIAEKVGVPPGTVSGIKANLTRRRKSAGKKAAVTKRAKKVAAMVKDRQWEPKKVKYLLGLIEKAISDKCIVCGESRPAVLQVHHVDRDRKIKAKLCANCHDIIRRGTVDELKKVHGGDGE